jgi:hypothetical protein
LFSGSLPSKSLRMLMFLNCASISSSTFLNIRISTYSLLLIMCGSVINLG